MSENEVEKANEELRQAEMKFTSKRVDTVLGEEVIKYLQENRTEVIGRALKRLEDEAAASGAVQA